MSKVRQGNFGRSVLWFAVVFGLEFLSKVYRTRANSGAKQIGCPSVCWDKQLSLVGGAGVLHEGSIYAVKYRNA